METLLNNVVCPKIGVVISASQLMTRENLALIIRSNRQFTVLGTVGVNAEIIDTVSRKKPDVLLLYLAENEGEQIELLRDVRRIAPQVKTVVLSNPGTALDQTTALKLGVAGIVGATQSARTLVRAIEQVADGEVWLNQNLITQLLNGSLKNGQSPKYNSSSNGKNFLRDDLTHREMEVVRMIGGGMCNKEISKKLFISEATVRHHLSSIYSKLGIEDRLNLAIYAYRRKIVLPSKVDASAPIYQSASPGFAAADCAV